MADTSSYLLDITYTTDCGIIWHSAPTTTFSPSYNHFSCFSSMDLQFIHTSNHISRNLETKLETIL